MMVATVNFRRKGGNFTHLLIDRLNDDAID